ncbi:mucin-2-like [Lytechinus pictus]|uniref:mucin-2-like n=1 Tax=Lytechinus pictus TaxID=7653 RepID=UPI0030BA049E
MGLAANVQLQIDVALSLKSLNVKQGSSNSHLLTSFAGCSSPHLATPLGNYSDGDNVTFYCTNQTTQPPLETATCRDGTWEPSFECFEEEQTDIVTEFVSIVSDQTSQPTKDSVHGTIGVMKAERGTTIPSNTKGESSLETELNTGFQTYTVTEVHSQTRPSTSPTTIVTDIARSTHIQEVLSTEMDSQQITTRESLGIQDTAHPTDVVTKFVSIVSDQTSQPTKDSSVDGTIGDNIGERGTTIQSKTESELSLGTDWDTEYQTYTVMEVQSQTPSSTSPTSKIMSTATDGDLRSTDQSLDLLSSFLRTEQATEMLNSEDGVRANAQQVATVPQITLRSGPHTTLATENCTGVSTHILMSSISDDSSSVDIKVTDVEFDEKTAFISELTTGVWPERSSSIPIGSIRGTTDIVTEITRRTYIQEFISTEMDSQQINTDEALGIQDITVPTDVVTEFVSIVSDQTSQPTEDSVHGTIGYIKAERGTTIHSKTESKLSLGTDWDTEYQTYTVTDVQSPKSSSTSPKTIVTDVARATHIQELLSTEMDSQQTTTDEALGIQDITLPTDVVTEVVSVVSDQTSQPTKDSVDGTIGHNIGERGTTIQSKTESKLSLGTDWDTEYQTYTVTDVQSPKPSSTSPKTIVTDVARATHIQELLSTEMDSQQTTTDEALGIQDINLPTDVVTEFVSAVSDQTSQPTKDSPVDGTIGHNIGERGTTIQSKTESELSLGTNWDTEYQTYTVTDVQSPKPSSTSPKTVVNDIARPTHIQELVSTEMDSQQITTDDAFGIKDITLPTDVVTEFVSIVLDQTSQPTKDSPFDGTIGDSIAEKGTTIHSKTESELSLRTDWDTEYQTYTVTDVQSPKPSSTLPKTIVTDVARATHIQELLSTEMDSQQINTDDALGIQDITFPTDVVTEFLSIVLVQTSQPTKDSPVDGTIGDNIGQSGTTIQSKTESELSLGTEWDTELQTYSVTDVQSPKPSSTSPKTIVTDVARATHIQELLSTEMDSQQTTTDEALGIQEITLPTDVVTEFVSVVLDQTSQPTKDSVDGTIRDNIGERGTTIQSKTESELSLGTDWDTEYQTFIVTEVQSLTPSSTLPTTKITSTAIVGDPRSTDQSQEGTSQFLRTEQATTIIRSEEYQNTKTEKATTQKDDTVRTEIVTTFVTGFSTHILSSSRSDITIIGDIVKNTEVVDPTTPLSKSPTQTGMDMPSSTITGRVQEATDVVIGSDGPTYISTELDIQQRTTDGSIIMQGTKLSDIVTDLMTTRITFNDTRQQVKESIDMITVGVETEIPTESISTAIDGYPKSTDQSSDMKSSFLGTETPVSMPTTKGKPGAKTEGILTEISDTPTLEGDGDLTTEIITGISTQIIMTRESDGLNPWDTTTPLPSKSSTNTGIDLPTFKFESVVTEKSDIVSDSLEITETEKEISQDMDFESTATYKPFEMTDTTYSTLSITHDLASILERTVGHTKKQYPEHTFPIGTPTDRSVTEDEWYTETITYSIEGKESSRDIGQTPAPTETDTTVVATDKQFILTAHDDSTALDRKDSITFTLETDQTTLTGKIRSEDAAEATSSMATEDVTVIDSMDAITSDVSEFSALVDDATSVRIVTDEVRTPTYKEYDDIEVTYEQKSTSGITEHHPETTDISQKGTGTIVISELVSSILSEAPSISTNASMVSERMLKSTRPTYDVTTISEDDSRTDILLTERGDTEPISNASTNLIDSTVTIEFETAIVTLEDPDMLQKEISTTRMVRQSDRVTKKIDRITSREVTANDPFIVSSETVETTFEFDTTFKPELGRTDFMTTIVYPQSPSTLATIGKDTPETMSTDQAPEGLISDFASSYSTMFKTRPPTSGENLHSTAEFAEGKTTPMFSQAETVVIKTEPTDPTQRSSTDPVTPQSPTIFSPSVSDELISVTLDITGHIIDDLGDEMTTESWHGTGITLATHTDNPFSTLRTTEEKTDGKTTSALSEAETIVTKTESTAPTQGSTAVSVTPQSPTILSLSVSDELISVRPTIDTATGDITYDSGEDITIESWHGIEITTAAPTENPFTLTEGRAIPSFSDVSDIITRIVKEEITEGVTTVIISTEDIMTASSINTTPTNIMAPLTTTPTRAEISSSQETPVVHTSEVRTDKPSGDEEATSTSTPEARTYPNTLSTEGITVAPITQEIHTVSEDTVKPQRITTVEASTYASTTVMSTSSPKFPATTRPVSTSPAFGFYTTTPSGSTTEAGFKTTTTAPSRLPSTRDTSFAPTDLKSDSPTITRKSWCDVKCQGANEICIYSDEGYSCRCIDGHERVDDVCSEVYTFKADVKIVLIKGREAIFTPELTISSSTYFKELETEFCKAMELTYKTYIEYTSSFYHCDIINFRPGSIIVEYMVSFTSPSVNEAMLMNETLVYLVNNNGTFPREISLASSIVEYGPANECLLNLSDCDPAAKCIDRGSAKFTCRCSSGYDDLYEKQLPGRYCSVTHLPPYMLATWVKVVIILGTIVIIIFIVLLALCTMGRRMRGRRSEDYTAGHSEAGSTTLLGYGYRKTNDVEGISYISRHSTLEKREASLVEVHHEEEMTESPRSQTDSGVIRTGIRPYECEEVLVSKEMDTELQARMDNIGRFLKHSAPLNDSLGARIDYSLMYIPEAPTIPLNQRRRSAEQPTEEFLDSLPQTYL